MPFSNPSPSYTNFTHSSDPDLFVRKHPEVRRLSPGVIRKHVDLARAVCIHVHDLHRYIRRVGMLNNLNVKPLVVRNHTLVIPQLHTHKRRVRGIVKRRRSHIINIHHKSVSSVIPLLLQVHVHTISRRVHHRIPKTN